MNSKRIWYIIPQAILPYFILFILAIVFYSNKLPFFQYIMENILNNNGLWLLLILFIYCIITSIISIICFINSIRKNWDPLSTAKCATVLKLAQVPAYYVIFILGVLFFLTIFTFAFSIILIWLDCLCLCFSALLILSSTINANRKGIMTFSETTWVIILQFVFCADVVASIIYFKKLQKRYSQIQYQKNITVT